MTRRSARGEDDGDDGWDEFGIEGEVRDAAEEQDDDDGFELWPENAGALEMFLALQTQWRMGAMGGFLGLDYLRAEAVMRMMRIKDRRKMFDDLRAMEAAALPILNEPKP